MSVYGPFTAVAGTLQACAVSPTAGAIYVRNTSRFDLALSLQDAQPFVTTNFGGTPWDVVIPAGDRAGVNLAVGRYPNGFSGQIWVLPIDNSGSLALSGTKSGNNGFYLEGYADASVLPPDYASAQFANLASQPRVITIPTEPHILAQFPAVTLDASPTIDSIAEITGSGLVGGRAITIYLYTLACALLHANSAIVAWYILDLDGSSFQLASHEILQQFYRAELGQVPMLPPSPRSINYVLAANVASIWLGASVISSWPSPTQTAVEISGDMSLDVDLLGQTPPPAIGNGIATPPGVVY